MFNMKYIKYLIVSLVAIVFSMPIWASALIPLPTNQGGTGLSSPGTSGNVLTSNGTIWTSAPATGGGEAFATSTFANSDRLVWTTLQATWSSMDAGDVLFGSATYYKRQDLTNAYRFRTIRAMGTAGPAGTSIKLQYSTDRTNWFDANSSAADDCTLVGTASTPCPWATLVQGARTDVWLRYISVGGTGTAVSFRDLTTEFNTYATTDIPNATTTQSLPWSTGGTFLQWSNIPLAKSGSNYINFSSATYYKVANLAQANKYRIHSAVATTTNALNTPISGTTVDFQYSYDGTNWFNLQSGTASPATGTGELDISVTSELNTLVTGNWVDIADGGKGNVFLRAVAYGGNGTNDIRFAYLGIEVETDLQAESVINDWTFGTTYGETALTPTSTIPLWLKDTLYASSTSIFSDVATFLSNVGIGTTSPMSKLSVDGDVAFQGTNFATTTIGDKNSSLQVGNGNFGGGTFPNIDIPLIVGQTLDSSIGALKSVGLNNELIIFEDRTLNAIPTLSFGAADFGDTGNSASISYATSTPALKVNIDWVIENANDNPTLQFNTTGGATSSNMFLTIEDSFFHTGATGGYFYDNAIAILGDEGNNLVFGSTNGSIISALSFSTSTDRLSFVQADGGYLFDGNLGIGETPFAPLSRLHITDGDVWIASSTRGVILTSPDDSCWRVTVSDLGALSTNSITCPN